jgi:hypothetical protein
MGHLQPLQLMYRPKFIRQNIEITIRYEKNNAYRTELSKLMGTQKIFTQYGLNRIDFLKRKIRLTS